MSKSAIFKSTSFGGFDRKSVLTYIDELGVKTAQKEEEFNVKINELSSANSELSKQIADFHSKISSVEGQLKEERQKMSHLTGELDRLNVDILSYKKDINEKNRDIQIKDEQYSMVCAKLVTMEDKAEMYQNTAAEVGAVIIEAKHSANMIVKRAMCEVDSIREATSKNLETVTVEIGLFKHDVDTLRMTISEVMTSITIRLDDLMDCVDDLDNRCKKMSQPLQPEEYLETV